MKNPANAAKKPATDLSQAELWILKSLQAGRQRYGLEIRNLIKRSFGRTISFSSLYPKLESLEQEGFIEAQEGEESLEGVGTKRRYFKITDAGRDALEQWEAAYASMPR